MSVLSEIYLSMLQSAHHPTESVTNTVTKPKLDEIILFDAQIMETYSKVHIMLCNSLNLKCFSLSFFEDVLTGVLSFYGKITDNVLFHFY